jgi:hypothetical protein
MNYKDSKTKSLIWLFCLAMLAIQSRGAIASESCEDGGVSGGSCTQTSSGTLSASPEPNGVQVADNIPAGTYSVHSATYGFLGFATFDSTGSITQFTKLTSQPISGFVASYINGTATVSIVNGVKTVHVH